MQISVGVTLFLENPELVDLVEPAEILIDPELMEIWNYALLNVQK